MVTWAAPLAGLLTLAAVLPVLAHLLSRRRPARMPFPTLRFVRAASPVTRRVSRRVQDWPLLLLRLAIVALIAAAAAGPTWTTAQRQQAWQHRLHRVFVVEDAAREMAADEIARLAKEATSAHVADAGNLAVALPRAIAHAASAVRSQQVELVLVWDGSRTALTPADLASVPSVIGVRLHPVRVALPAHAPTSRGVPPVTIVAADTDARARLDILAKLRALDLVAGPVPLRILWPGAAHVGMPDASTHAGTPEPGVLDQLADDARLRDAAQRSLVDARARRVEPREAAVLARSSDGVPLLHAWWADAQLVLALHAPPSSPLGVWSAIAAVEALSNPARSFARHADDVWTAAEIAAEQREPSMPLAPMRLPGGLDTRAAWALVLALLLVEQWARRARRTDLDTSTDVSSQPGATTDATHVA